MSFLRRTQTHRVTFPINLYNYVPISTQQNYKEKYVYKLERVILNWDAGITERTGQPFRSKVQMQDETQTIKQAENSKCYFCLYGQAY